MVWPNVASNRSQQNQTHEEHEHHRHQQETFSSNSATDHPMAWMKNVSTADHQTQASEDDSPPSIDQKGNPANEVCYTKNITKETSHGSPPKAKSAPFSKTASRKRGITFWRSEAIKILTSLRDRGKHGKPKVKN